MCVWCACSDHTFCLYNTNLCERNGAQGFCAYALFMHLALGPFTNTEMETKCKVKQGYLDHDSTNSLCTV